MNVEELSRFTVKLKETAAHHDIKPANQVFGFGRQKPLPVELNHTIKY